MRRRTFFDEVLPAAVIAVALVVIAVAFGAAIASCNHASAEPVGPAPCPQSEMGSGLC